MSRRLLVSAVLCALCGWAALSLMQTIHAQQSSGPRAIVRHGFTLNGRIEGSVHQLSGETTTLNTGSAITGDLLVPGTPTVLRNGSPIFGGVVQGSGNAQPSNYQVTLNGSVQLGHLVTRTNPVAMPNVAAPPASVGTRSVIVNSPGQSVGDFSTLRDLTLNGNVGMVAVPPGTYRQLMANGGGGFIFGVAGSSQPSVYNLNSLTLNAGSQLQIVGPVVLTTATSLTLNAAMGASSQPLWLDLRVASGGVTLNGGSSLYGFVTAPAGTIIINGNTRLVGGVVCDRLNINTGGLLRLLQQTDSVAPVINVTQPTANTFFNTTNVTVTGTFSDESATTITVNGVAATIDGNSFNATVPLVEGQNTLLIAATDAAGNRGEASRSVVRDTIAPAIAIQQPANNLVTRNAEVSVTGTYTDANAAVIKVNGVTATLSGNAFSAMVTLAEGANQLQVSAVDVAGNNNALTHLVTKDTVLPAITVTQPANQAVTKDTQITVVGTLNDATAVTVTVNGNAGVVSGSNFSAVIPVSEGTNEVKIAATDAAGNYSEATRSVVRDTMLPDLLVEQPYEGSFINASEVTVSGTIADTTTAAVSVNGMTAAISNGRFTIAVPLNLGANTLDVRAVDAAGNQTGVPLAVRRVADNSPPSLTLASPANGIITGSNIITVSGTATDEAPVAISLNGMRIDVSPAGAFTGVVHLPVGASQIVVIAEDAVGNRSQETRTVTVDNTAPVLSDLTPTEGTNVNAPTVTVKGRISDETPVTVKVNGVNAVVNSSNIFEASGVSLSEGVNYLSVEAIDQAGNRSVTPMVLVGGDVTPPAPPVFFPIKPQTRLAFQTLEGRAEPGATVKIVGGTEPVSVEAAFGSGLFAVQVKLATGINALNASTADAAGNASAAVNFTITSNPQAPPPPPGEPYQINVSTGGGQRGLNGAELPRPLIALVTNRAGDPLPNVRVTFTNTHGDGKFAGGGNSVEVLTDAHGHASTRYTCGSTAGVYLVRADFLNNASTPAVFVAESVEGGTATTSVSGVVLDQNLRALPNVLARMGGQQARTGADGRFKLDNVATGPHQVIELIGRDQITLPGRWPNISYDLDVLPGIENSLGRPLFLPRVNEGVDVPLDAGGIVTSDVTFELPVVGGEPPIRVTARTGTRITFPPDVTNKKLSVTRIATNRVPMVLEDGRASNLYISVQPSGAVFDQPLEITFPNLDRLPAGSETLLMSFDHDAGRYVKVGTGHVSTDGRTVKSDPGSGIRVGAWHALPPDPPQPEVTVLGQVQITGNPMFKNKAIVNAEAWVEGERAVLLTTQDEADVWSFRATYSLAPDAPPEAKMEATFDTVPVDEIPEVKTVDAEGNPVADAGAAAAPAQWTQLASLSAPDKSSKFAASASDAEGRESSRDAYRAAPVFASLQSPPRATYYGGSTVENSDHFWVLIPPSDVAAYVVRKYDWKVSGPGAETYTPPPPSPTASRWEVGKVNPHPGILEFKCVMTVRSRGARIPSTRVESGLLRIEVGVTTDNVAVIGWINPAGVSLTGEDMDSDMLRYYPLDGAASMSAVQKGLTTAHMGTLAAAGAAGSGRTIHPRWPRAMTPSEKRHTLNWMFKFAGNYCSKNRCPPTSFASNEALQAFKEQQTTSYKMFNQYQVKYLVENGRFKMNPLAIRFAAEIGVTNNPVFDIEEAGAAGPYNRRSENLGDVTYLINDGTPTVLGVSAFNALTYPLKWSHIGSRIEFGIRQGTTERVFNQVYPTYYIFSNLKHTGTRPQASEPIGNFNTNPYPPGPAPFIP